jgi:hypothetical protein
MQLHPASTVPPRQSQPIPYSSAALRQDMDRLRSAGEDAQSSRATATRSMGTSPRSMAESTRRLEGARPDVSVNRPWRHRSVA